jgi:PKD repeat protein
MRSMKYLPVALLLLFSMAMRGQMPSVHLESGGVTITQVCESSSTYLFVGTNSSGAIGTFALFEAVSGHLVTGHITDQGNNTAIFNPLGLDGDYRVDYTYVVGAISTTVSSIFTVYLLDDIEIQDLPETVCKNDPPYPLVPVPSLSDPGAVYSFSGPGVSGSQASGYYYSPASPQVGAGWVQITLNYTSSNGCSVSLDYSIYNGFVPTLDFAAATSCIPSLGGAVQFNNLTNGKYAVNRWSWNFGDPGSGSKNTSTAEAPVHTYPKPGSWNVTLAAETYDGCQANISKSVLFLDKPVVDFTPISDCFVRGVNTEFVDQSVSLYSPINLLRWTFKTSGGGVLGQITRYSTEDTVQFPFASIAAYSVTLEVQNEDGCSGDLTKTVLLKPVYELTRDGQLETFDDQPADWLVDSEEGLESWVLGEPDFTGYEAVPGDLAWYTILPQSTTYLENSWVQSPCFDISAMSKPMVLVDLMKSFVPGTDGTVMQYQRNLTDGWITIGTVDEGLNWYNNYGIFNEPGGSSFGWGLSQFTPDSDWVHAGYGMDGLAGVPYVKFRIAIGTGGRQALGNQGFAFDNFFIGDRVKKSLIEHFTNSSSSEAIAADQIVEQFVSARPDQVIDIQYHMDYPGVDSMNLNNPLPPSIRAFNYGVPAVPYATLNGGSGPEFRFDFSDPSEEPTREVLIKSALDILPFDVTLNANFLANRLDGRVTVTCKSDDFSSNIQLYIAVVEKLVTAYTGAEGTTKFRNVVLDMLPTASGKLLGDEWGKGVSKNVDFNWNYASYLEDKEDLMLVAFIMDRDYNKIVQTVQLDYSPGTSAGDRQAADNFLSIFPNPAREFVYINFGTETGQAGGELRFTDLAGRSVLSRDVMPGYSIQKVDISSLPQGVYLVQWTSSGILMGRGKLVRSR